MVLFGKAGFVIAIAATTCVKCQHEDEYDYGYGSLLSLRSLDLDDFYDLSDIYSRDLFDDDEHDDSYMEVRDLDDLEDQNSPFVVRDAAPEDIDVDLLYSKLARRQQPQAQLQPQLQPVQPPQPAQALPNQQPAPVTPPMLTAKNTAQDIAQLCAKPNPSAQDFTSFFSRSGLDASRALFWSGIKDSTAMRIGASLNRVTLEMMVKPNNVPLAGCDKHINGLASQTWWNAASEGFGNWANGQIAVVFSQKRHDEIKGGKSLSTWVRVEAPALWRKFKARVGDAVSAMRGMMQRLRGAVLAGTAPDQAFANKATSTMGGNANASGSRSGNGLESVLMYICDSEGNNLSQPRAYDGPAPVQQVTSR